MASVFLWYNIDIVHSLNLLYIERGSGMSPFLAIAVGGEHCPRYCYPKWLSPFATG